MGSNGVNYPQQLPLQVNTPHSLLCCQQISIANRPLLTLKRTPLFILTGGGGLFDKTDMALWGNMKLLQMLSAPPAPQPSLQADG